MVKNKKEVLLGKGKYILVNSKPQMVFRRFRDDELIPNGEGELPIVVERISRQFANLRASMNAVREISNRTANEVLWFPEETFFSEETVTSVQSVGDLLSNVMLIFNGIRDLYDEIFEDAMVEIVTTIDAFRERLREQEMNPEDLANLERAMQRSIEEFERHRREEEEARNEDEEEANKKKKKNNII